MNEKIKSRLSKITTSIILVICLLVIATLVCAVSPGEVLNHYYDPQDRKDGIYYEKQSFDKGELFLEYLPELTQEIPTTLPRWMFSYAFNISWWCKMHGTAVHSFLTATEAHYWAYNYDPLDLSLEWLYGTYSADEVYRYYWKKGSNGKVEEGFVPLWPQWVEDINEAATRYKYGYVSSYGKYDEELIAMNDATMPGIGVKKVNGLEYELKQTYPLEDVQDVLYALTVQRVYANANDYPDSESVTQEEMENGYFTVAEKQTAVWETHINNGRAVGTGAGGEVDDRNLGEASNGYQEFYNNIHENILEGETDGYGENFVEAMWYDDQEVYHIGENEDAEAPHVEEIEKIEIEGEEYKTYQYNDTEIMVDKADKTLTMGPFALDFSVDDETKDRYLIGGTEDSFLKFNAVENITVYNQDKTVKLTSNPADSEYGAYYTIAYEADAEGAGLIDAKEKHIMDYDGFYYYENADGQEIYAFDTQKPFYIVVHRGTMPADKFTNFYAKIDIQYLSDIEGNVYEYEANVIDYYFNRDTKIHKETYSGTITYWGIADYDEDGDPIYDWVTTGYSQSYDVDTVWYELIRLDNEEDGQWGIGLNHSNFWRNYKTYSVVLTSKPNDEPPILIKIIKNCEKCGPLYGATFEVTAEVSGYDEMNGSSTQFNKELELGLRTSGYNTQDGSFYIMPDEWESAPYVSGSPGGNGVSLDHFTGTIILKLEEISAPAGHKLLEDEYKLQIDLKNGKVTTWSSGTVTENSEYVLIQDTIENKEVGTPVIQIEKVEKTLDGSGETLGGVIAKFKVQVDYTDPDTNETIHNEKNIIKGQTNKDGIYTLTKEDFSNLGGKNSEGKGNGFDITGYTGTITLRIIEIEAKGYTVTPRSKTIDLEFQDGALLEYTKYTDEEVMATQVYANPWAEIYKYINNKNYVIDEEKFPYLKEYIDNWAYEQITNNAADADENAMKYEDVLGWLANYIEEKANDPESGITLDSSIEENANDSESGDSRIEEFRLSTMTTESYINEDGNSVIRIVIEDSPTTTTIELPDIPNVPKDDYLLMKLAGKAFLDSTSTKEAENKADGKMGNDEVILSGIKVTLHDATTGSLAELVQKEGEIRTNPTITDENGYYEFRGLDPLHTYYVEFTYNGMEYKITQSEEAKYNSQEWAVTSKAGSESKDLDKYKVVTVNTKCYEASEIQGLYEEMTTYRLYIIRTENRFPKDEDVKKYLLGLHQNDQFKYEEDVEDMVDYMLFENQATAYAGYSSKSSSNDQYPYYEIRDKFVMSISSINGTKDGTTEIFANQELPLIYPGQLEVNLGLVERPEADLSLTSDLTDTTVSINKYDTNYEYDKGLGSYHQYIYEEDYNYRTSGDQQTLVNEDSDEQYEVAYYTEDNVHFYVTYEIKLENARSQTSFVREIINYYNSEFIFKSNGDEDGYYITTEGNKIPVITSYKGIDVPDTLTNELGITATSKSQYDAEAKNEKEYGYEALYLQIPDAIESGSLNRVNIRITFELVGDTGETGNAKAVLAKYLEPQDDGSINSWLIRNYSEINAYSAEASDEQPILDIDSHPGNFNIEEYDKLQDDYSNALIKFFAGVKTEEQKRIMSLCLLRAKELQEDDSWVVGLTLINNGYVREMTGNVWEAISDDIKSSLYLQPESGVSKYLEYEAGDDRAKYDLSGIRVELVELIKEGDSEEDPNGNQMVRAVDITDDYGTYTFKSFIAGDYTVRFVYGGDDATTTSKVSTNTFKPEDEADYLPVNGQYYQSTKANPNTDGVTYWYANTTDSKKRSDITAELPKDSEERYSDAYDDAYSRRTQMLSEVSEKEGVEDTSAHQNAEGENKETQTSSDYNYQGVISVESWKHNDPIYAYTSTMEIEIEYIRPEAIGNNSNPWYEYKIHNVDFGVTPRSYNDVNIRQFISEVALTTQTGSSYGSEELARAIYKETIGESGNIVITKTHEYINGEELNLSDSEDQKKAIFATTVDENVEGYPDGIIRVDYDPTLLQNAKLELTYTVVVTNDSEVNENKEPNDEDGFDKITYIYQNEKVIAVKYYNEDTEKLVSYESDDLRSNAPTIVYHNRNDVGEYSSTSLQYEKAKRMDNTSDGRLQHYTLITNYTEGERLIITSQVKNIVEFVGKPLAFLTPEGYLTPEGTEMNCDWELTDPEYYVSARENYDTSLEYHKDISESYENSLLANTITSSVRFKDNVDNEEGHNLYAELKPGEEVRNTITLTATLSTDSSDTNDYEYSSNIEITRLANLAGKIVDIEGYVIDGRETSEVRHLTDIQYPDITNGTYTPTISNSKTPTLKLGVPAGLTIIDSTVVANLGIVLVALVIFAGGVILIKKFVLGNRKAT